MKINKIFVAVMAAIGLTSCNDWLDMEAYKSDDTEFAFQNETNADLFVQGCYRGIVPGDFIIKWAWVMVLCIHVRMEQPTTLSIIFVTISMMLLLLRL